jgi:hypothetical protein
MTMSNVIANYLRWFRLNQAKKTILNGMSPVRSHIPWTQALRSHERSPGWGLQSTFPAEGASGAPVLIEDEESDTAVESEIADSYEAANVRASKRA